MISLDKKIMDENSPVAARMIEYGKTDELFILIPDNKKQALNLSDTVYVESTGGNKIAQFFRLIKLGKKIIKANEIKAITVQDPFYLGKAGWLLKRKFKLDLEVQLHGDFFGSDYYKKENPLKYRLGKFIIKRADSLRAVSERIKQSLIKIGIAENKIEIKPVKFDAEYIKNYQPKINLREKYPNKKVFLFLGRLAPVKNVDFLQEIFKLIANQRKDYLLLVVGGGDIKVKESENIKVENWTNDPISYLKTADCVLFPSLSEGYGLVPMEAVAAGAKVIMSDVGVANYELKPSQTVKIIPLNDKPAWIEAILNV